MTTDKIKARHLDDEFLQTLYGEHNPPPFAMDLLWENASPSSAFAAQNIPLDLSDYSVVCVAFNHSPTNELTLDTTFCKKGKQALGYGMISSVWYWRMYAFTENGISFEQVMTSDVGEKYNDKLIPTQIYGIK